MELSRSRRGLQKKFVASLLIVGFSPGIVALFATYLYSIQTIKTSIGGSFQQIAASTARRIEVMIDDEIDGARHLAATPLTVRASAEASNGPYRTEDPQAIRARLLQRSSQWERYRGGQDQVLPSYIDRGTLVYIRDWYAVRAGGYQNLLVTDAQGALVASVAPPLGTCTVMSSGGGKPSPTDAVGCTSATFTSRRPASICWTLRSPSWTAPANAPSGWSSWSCGVRI